MTKVYEAWGYEARLSDWAEMFKLDRSTLYKRLERGMDLETALSMGKYQSDKWPKYTYNGVSHTAREWAEIIGIEPRSFMDRIRAGMPQEKVFAKGDLRIKDAEKRIPAPVPKKLEKGMVQILYCDELGVKPSVATIKASDFDFWRSCHKYVARIR